LYNKGFRLVQPVEWLC